MNKNRGGPRILNNVKSIKRKICRANTESLLGHLAYNKIGGVEDDFTYMTPLEDASDHDRSPSR